MSSTDSPSPSPAAPQPAPAAGPAPEPPAAEAEDQAARALLGKLKLNKVAAPPDLASRVPDLIQRRSAGRFFAKRRLADRLPLEWVSLVMLALLALIYAVLRMAPALLPAN